VQYDTLTDQMNRQEVDRCLAEWNGWPAGPYPTEEPDMDARADALSRVVEERRRELGLSRAEAAEQMFDLAEWYDDATRYAPAEPADEADSPLELARAETAEAG
jgi:hypothetical protein